MHRDSIKLALTCLFVLAFVRDANAYLDPGTGGFFLQLLLAALAGLFFAIKLFWGKVKALFRRTMEK